MCTTLNDFVLKAGFDSGLLSFQANNWTIQQAKNSYEDIKTCGIEGNWGLILDNNWAQSLPIEFQIEWNNLSKFEQSILEDTAVRKAKETERNLILDLAHENNE